MTTGKKSNRIAKAGTQESYQNVLLEEMRSGFSALGEKLDSLIAKLDRRANSRKEQIERLNSAIL